MTTISPPETPEQYLQRILYETRQLVARGQVDEARPGIDELTRLLKDGPAIEQLRRAVVVVNLQREAVREPLAIEAAAAPDPASIDLVAFHADLAHPPTEAHPRIDYGPLLCLFFEAARIRAPRARSILLTDEHTRLPDGLGADQVLRFPIDLTRLMYERMRVQTAYLEGRAAGRASVLLDSDVVVNREPSIIFGERFDLGLTWRRELPDAPFNGGVILAAAGSGAVAFFKTARACYDEIAAEPAIATAFPQDLRAWWGDQFAIAATVGYRAFRERSSEGLLVDGVRVRFLPCEDYNFTMEPRRTYDRQFIAAKRFVHFKGNRKALQHEYLAAMKAGQV